MGEVEEDVGEIVMEGDVTLDVGNTHYNTQVTYYRIVYILYRILCLKPI